ncbi:putative RNA-directed DNA polymerase from transposon BS, partial [Stegodyphus mimosarum]
MKLQQQIPAIENWCRRWRISINAQKSTLLLIRRKRRKTPGNSKIILFGQEVPQVSRATYLGVTLNEQLKWTDHVNKVRGKAFAAFNSLKPLLGKFSTLDLRRKRLVYLTTIRPIISYASPAWSTMSVKDVNKLQVVQNKVLRAMTNANMYVSNVTLHHDLQLPSIKEHLHKQNR